MAGDTPRKRPDAGRNAGGALVGPAALFALPLLLAACEQEHEAIGAAIDRGEFGPARLISMPDRYLGDREAFLAVGKEFCPQGRTCEVLFFAEGFDPGVPPTPEALSRSIGFYRDNPLSFEVTLRLRCDLGAADPNDCV